LLYLSDYQNISYKVASAMAAMAPTNIFSGTGGEAEPPSARCHAPRVHFGPQHGDGTVASPHRFQTLKQAQAIKQADTRE